MEDLESAKRVDLYQPLESAKSISSNMYRFSMERENFQPVNSNPFGSLEDKLSSLISERKAVEKQTKNEYIKKGAFLKK